MNTSDLPRIRLQNQHLSVPDFNTPEDAVSWFGAVQAQDYLGSLWAVGQRMRKGTEKDVEDALAKRTIVRSWPMRGTLHFVAAQDLRWMLKLLTPRIFKRSASRYRELELTDETFKKSEKVFIKALIGGNQKTREELLTVLESNKISPAGQRGIHILGHLAMEGLLCFGTREGKQFTFTLLDEWIPSSKVMDHDESLAELTKRYFISHGPAMIKDFVWWSGLTVAEVKKGIEMVQPYLTHETVDGQMYWLGQSQSFPKKTQNAWLLPAYDEYTVAYKDRSAIIESNHFIQAGNGLRPTIVINGQIVGIWKREIKKHEVIITTHLFHLLSKAETEALHTSANRYGEFLGRQIVLR